MLLLDSKKNRMQFRSGIRDEMKIRGSEKKSQKFKKCSLPWYSVSTFSLSFLKCVMKEGRRNTGDLKVELLSLASWAILPECNF